MFDGQSRNANEQMVYDPWTEKQKIPSAWVQQSFEEIFVSFDTDFYFYTEQDKTHTQNTYGKTKL